MSERRGNPCAYVVPCREVEEPEIKDGEEEGGKDAKAAREVYHDALPRYVTFSYFPPAYYAVGFSILPVYKRTFDFTEMRKLMFLEDPDKVDKWGDLRARLPFPEKRLVDLPGTRASHFKNYCLRRLTPESAMSWRRSIGKTWLEKLEEAKGGATPGESGSPAGEAVKGRRLGVACRNKNCIFR